MMMNTNDDGNNHNNDDALLPVSSSSAEPAATRRCSPTTSSPTEERARRTLSLSSCLNLWHESDGALHPPALLAAESSASSVFPGDNKDDIIILEESRSGGGAPSPSSSNLIPTIARPTAEQQQQQQQRQQQPHRRRGSSSSRARSASLDRLCLFNQNHRDTDRRLTFRTTASNTMFRSVSDSALFTLGATSTVSVITASQGQKVRSRETTVAAMETRTNLSTTTDTTTGCSRSGSEADAGLLTPPPPESATADEVTKTGQRQRRRRKVVVVRKTTTEKRQETRSDNNRNGNKKYYHPNDNNRNKSTVLVFPTTVVVGIMLGIVVAFVAVSLRRSANEIADLRSTVLKLQSTVLELQSTVMIDLRSTSSTVAGEKTVIQEESTNNHASNAAEVEQQTMTTTTMEHVVEALVNLDKAVNQIESNIVASTTTRQRTEEPFVDGQIIGNKKSASLTTATTETLTFDDRALTTNFDRLPDGYHGLGFSNMWTGSAHMMMEDNDCIERSGLLHGRISYPAVAVNANGDPASIRAMRDDDDDNDDDDDDATKSISLSSLVATPVGRNNVQLNIEGLRGSTIVRATMVTLPSTQRPTLIELEGFEDLTDIRLETIGGEIVFEDCQCSPIVAFDDIVVYRTKSSSSFDS